MTPRTAAAVRGAGLLREAASVHAGVGTAMEFKVLGPLTVTEGDLSAHLPGGLRRRLLAALLVNLNSVVSADRLVHILWGDDAPPSASRNLHNQVWRVRAALDECSPGMGAALITQPPGYQLRVDPQVVDAVRFEQAVTGAVAESAERPDRAAAQLTKALELWRGAPYAEFAGQEFCRYEAMRLEELRLVAIEERFEAIIASGRHAELNGEIEAFAAEHPLRERPQDLLMMVLHRAGRQADAAAVYREFRRRLVEQMGLEPSAALRRRHEHILHTDPVPEPDRRRARVGNLRLELSDLVGRGDDITRALATLRHTRVLTMTGVGGVGKTRLALRVAAEASEAFPHGVWVCELGAVRDGWLVPDVLATTLGMQALPGATVTDGLVDFLRSRRALLVIDNCEHVLDAAAHLVDAVARDCPEVVVLATSREPLGVDGEHVLPVGLLEVPPPDAGRDVDRVAAVPSVALFVRRASAATATFTVGAHNIAEVAEICRRLDGLPLAIELAATRLRSMSVAEVAARLERRLDFLHSTRRVREERHGTLGTVVGWSYNLLAPVDRAGFDRLSVLAGSFTLDDATAIAVDDDIGAAEVVDVVADLVHKSMLVAETEHTPTRYTMLETLRIYGREQLERSGRLALLQRRHAAHCVAVAEASSAGLAGADEAGWAARIAALLNDLRAAHSWALTTDPATAIRLSAALLRYTSAHGPAEMYRWADRAVAAATHEPPGPRLAAALAVAAAGAARRGDLADAEELVERGLRAVPERADPARRHLLWVLARVASFRGRLTDAATLYAKVAQLAEQVGDTHCVAYVTASGALQHAYQGAAERAVVLAGQAGKLAMVTRNPTAIAWAHYALGVALQDREPERALATLRQAREVGRAGGNTYIPGVALSVAAALMTRHGDVDQAARLTAEVIDYWSHESHWAQQWVALRTAVSVLARSGEYEAAATLHGALVASDGAIRPIGAEAELSDAVVGAVAGRLGDETFTAAVTRGATLSDDDAVVFAKTALDRIGRAGPAAPAHGVVSWSPRGEVAARS
ncbi:BTAD domain-containing putative transcriptional regulator [Amycolatopsis mediterranei]|uniref:BTAD domain-containing putative transcriptional regulator n=1 Tax=Amycolatopsis mediterranei TaxID=33910 RepID=UPI00342952E7